MKKLIKLVGVILFSLLALSLPLGLLTVMTASADSTGGDSSVFATNPSSVPLKAVGGPDTFGYTYQDEVEAFGPTYVFTDISGTGTNLGLDDDEDADITAGDLAGFDFEFYGAALSSLRVSNNGAMLVNPSILNPKISFSNNCPLSAAYPDHINLIAPWWDDWDDAGDVYWQLLGTAPNRQLIVQWDGMVHVPDTMGEGVTFQVILFETSNLILFQYQDTDAGWAVVDNGNSGTVGILANGTDNLQYETCNAGDPLTNSRAIRFQRSSITVAKDAVPDDEQDFEFSGSGAISSSFFLDDDADPTLSSSRTFFIVPGNYAITETVPAGWELTGLSCDGTHTPNLGTGRVDVSLGPADNLTCTYQNTKRGSITIVKDATPTDIEDFAFTGDLGPFTLDDDGTQGNPLSDTIIFSNLSPSTYNVTETVVSGWSLANINCVGGDFSTSGMMASISLDPGEDITCTFENVQPSTVVIEKVTEPANESQDFDFTTTVPATPTFTLNTGSGSISQTLSDLMPGNYVITESAVAGWNLTGLTCVDPTSNSSGDTGTREATINAAAGETVTCTFTNTKRGVINIIKDAIPDSSQDFSFTSSVPTTIPPFSLDDDTDPTLPDRLTNITVSPGVYTVTEGVVTNWSVSNIGCIDPTGNSSGDTGTRAATMDIAPGEVVTCTFTNQADPGRLIVEKITDPASDPQIFTFTTTMPATPTFTLSTGGPAPVSRTFSLTPSGTYSLTEDTLPDWDLANASCSDGSSVTSIGLDPGETVTCTFTNTKRGQIFADKVTDPASDPTSFDFSLTGGPDAINQSFALTDTTPARSSGFIKAGSYNLTETLVSGWTVSTSCDDSSSVDNINLGAGETITCVFTNTRQGTIRIVKDAVPDNSQSFGFTSDIPGNTSFTLDDDGLGFNSLDFTVMPGSYVVTETLPVANWSLAQVDCTEDGLNNSSGNLGAGTANITVEAAEVVTCTFTNQADPGQLIVEKVTDPASDPQVFTFTTTMPATPTFTLSTGGPAPISRTFILTADTYSVSEDALADWDLSNASCSDGSSPNSISLDPGEIVTCTFTNTKRGQISILKDAVPDATQVFAFTSNLGSFTLDDDGTQGNPLSNTITFPNLSAGTYNVTETLVSGWDVSTTCDDGSSVNSITLSPGETVTCVFTNTAQPGSITIVKDADPDDPQDFAFFGSGSIGNFSLDDDGTQGNPLSNTVTFSGLAAGSYFVIEGTTTGWGLSGLVCTDPTGDTTTQPAFGLATIKLGLGENITCTFTNTTSASLGTITIVKEATPEGTQPFTFTGTLGDFSLIDNGSLSNTITFTNQPAGTYVVTETVVTGWNLTGLSCSDPDGGTIANSGSRTAIIDLDAGENIICTFTNEVATSSPTNLYLPIILKSFVPSQIFDLTVPNVVVSNSTPGTGEAVEITVTLHNTGTAFATPFWVDLYLATTPIAPTTNQTWEDNNGNGNPDDDDTIVPYGVAWKVGGMPANGDKVITNLNPNDLTETGCRENNYSNFIPNGLECWPQTWKGKSLNNHFSNPGTYYLYVQVDSFDDVPPVGSSNGIIVEDNESNNLFGPFIITVSGSSLRAATASPAKEAVISAGDGRQAVRP